VPDYVSIGITSDVRFEYEKGIGERGKGQMFAVCTASVNLAVCYLAYKNCDYFQTLS
jgi:hypothetical protein